MREEMEGKDGGRFHFDTVSIKSTYPYLYRNLACKQLCFRQWKGKNGRNESTGSEEVLLFCSTDDNVQNSYFPTLFYSKVSKIDLPSVEKNIKYISLIITFPVKKGNSEE